jgi:hypothetical protein
MKVLPTQACIAGALRMVCQHGCRRILCAVRYIINKLGACRPIGVLHRGCAGHFRHHAQPCYRPMHAWPRPGVHARSKACPTQSAAASMHPPGKMAQLADVAAACASKTPHQTHHGHTATWKRPLHLHTGSNGHAQDCAELRSTGPHATYHAWMALLLPVHTVHYLHSELTVCS